MSERGWCPFARQHRGVGREGPFGYPAGTRNQNRPVVFVDHRMGGFKRTLDSDAWRFGNWVGVHAGIGRDGSIDQYANIFDASWGNGVAGSVQLYDRTNPRLALLETLGRWIAVPYAGSTSYALVTQGGVNVINAHSISTEHEDEGIDQPWPPAQRATSIAWHRWCLEELAREGLPMAVDQFTLVRHGDIDGVNRRGCPGTNYPEGELLEELSGGSEDEMYTRKIAPFWTNFKFDSGPTLTMALKVDFGVDAIAYDLDITPLRGAGVLIVKHGDGREAGRVRVAEGPKVIRVYQRLGTCLLEAQGPIETSSIALAGVLR